MGGAVAAGPLVGGPPVRRPARVLALAGTSAVPLVALPLLVGLLLELAGIFAVLPSWWGPDVVPAPAVRPARPPSARLSAARSRRPHPLPRQNSRAEMTWRAAMGSARANESIFPRSPASRTGPEGCAEGAPNVPDKVGGSGRGELASPLQFIDSTPERPYESAALHAGPRPGRRLTG